MNKKIGSTHYLSTESGFGIFFRENYHTACIIALKYVKNHQLAEDLVQDVFVTFWEKRNTFNIQLNLRNYLFVAVKNHAINLILRNKSVTNSLSELFNDLPEDDNSNAFNREELAVCIFNAIHELPKGCQTIFKLAYEQNFTYQEIADTLQISKNTVKTQMGIAYKQLRDKLKNLIINLLYLFLKK